MRRRSAQRPPASPRLPGERRRREALRLAIDRSSTCWLKSNRTVPERPVGTTVDQILPRPLPQGKVPTPRRRAASGRSTAGRRRGQGLECAAQPAPGPARDLTAAPRRASSCTRRAPRARDRGPLSDPLLPGGVESPRRHRRLPPRHRSRISAATPPSRSAGGPPRPRHAAGAGRGLQRHRAHRDLDFLAVPPETRIPDSAKMFTFRPGGDDAVFYDVHTLPKYIDDASPLARERFLEGPSAPVRHWLRRDIDGWRLDVAHQASPRAARRARNEALLRTVHRVAREENEEAGLRRAARPTPSRPCGATRLMVRFTTLAPPTPSWTGCAAVRARFTGGGHGRCCLACSPDDAPLLPWAWRETTSTTYVSSHDIPRALWRLRGDPRSG